MSSDINYHIILHPETILTLLSCYYFQYVTIFYRYMYIILTKHLYLSCKQSKYTILNIYKYLNEKTK